MRPPMLQPGQRYATEDELCAARLHFGAVRVLVVVPEGEIEFDVWRYVGSVPPETHDLFVAEPTLLRFMSGAASAILRGR